MASIWRRNFDIDSHINHLIPAPPWHAVPYPVSYFLGHRRSAPGRKYGNLLLTLRALLGVFVSLVLIQLISHQIPWVAANGPRIVASFGAAAVLEFCAFESPFAQPRNFFISQLIASVIGVSFAKLFQLRNHHSVNNDNNGDWVRWFGGALACAVTTALMDLTKTVHPPAGATALLAVVDDTAARLGWNLIPLVLLGCAVMLSVALLLNNVFSRFPVYWWTATTTGAAAAAAAAAEEKLAALPTVSQPSRSSSLGGYGGEEGEGAGVGTGAGETGPPRTTAVIISRGKVNVPDHLQLTPDERALLDRISRNI